MSISKRIYFDDDPAFDEAREEIRRSRNEYLSQFKFRIPDTRFKTVGGRKRKDRFWSFALNEGESAVGAESVRINGGVWFKTQDDRDKVLTIANRVYSAPHPLKRYC